MGDEYRIFALAGSAIGHCIILSAFLKGKLKPRAPLHHHQAAASSSCPSYLVPRNSSTAYSRKPPQSDRGEIDAPTRTRRGTSTPYPATRAMELYGYNPYYRSIPTRGGTSTGNMHSTIAFPGSNGRRGSLSVTSPSIGIAALTASPASITSPRVPNTPVVPNGAGPGGNGNGYDTSPKRPRRVERVIKPIKSVKGPDAR